MRILICGSRYWSDEKAIFNEMANYDVDTVIITGGCIGADTIAHNLAVKAGMETLVFPARWDKYGKAAGPIRNQQMLDEGLPDLVVAFTEDLENSRGTKDMVTRARKAKIPVRVLGRAMP
jgi:hypothetical protein